MIDEIEGDEDMNADVFLFWFLAVLTLAGGITTVLVTNPIYSALSLAFTMVGISALFVTLEAFFLAGVQLIVYAGAVTVLFVMVLMMFDLKHEVSAFTRGKLTGFIKWSMTALLAGLVVGSIIMTVDPLLGILPDPTTAVSSEEGPKELGRVLFSKYVFGFEVLGVLLLIVAIGVVALSRSKGGTHAKQ